MRGTIRSFLLFEAATFSRCFPHPLRGVDRRIRAPKGPHRRRRDRTRAFHGPRYRLGSRPASTRTAGLAGQAFALLGTLIGVFTIAVGVGPRTTPDTAYHIAIVVVLIWGLVITKYT
jgi:hypothetical protein